MMFKHSYWFWEAEIKPEICDKWVNEHFNINEVIGATVGNNNGELVEKKDARITDIVWVESGTEIFNALFNYIQSANLNAGWNFDLSGMENVQLGKYSDGGFYDWHIDAFDPEEGNWQRKLSCSIQLTDPEDYEGGDLIIKTTPQGSTETISRKKGTVVVFPSFIEHKVTPVTKGTRYSAVSWMRGQAFR